MLVTGAVYSYDSLSLILSGFFVFSFAGCFLFVRIIYFFITFGVWHFSPLLKACSILVRKEGFFGLFLEWSEAFLSE
jgi:hypothetical protein